jgi:hypothetical protein
VHGAKSTAALFTIASNVGRTSSGELAMAFRISAVAVCYCSASFNSRFSRAISISGPEI